LTRLPQLLFTVNIVPMLCERRYDTQHNNIQYNDTQYNDTQYNDTQHNDIQYNDTQHNDIQYNDTQHNTANDLSVALYLLLC
jgi:hypothetical protein